jgi:AraC-type DNA-binding domain-containing proteins
MVFTVSTIFFSKAVKNERMTTSGKVFENFIDKFMKETVQLRDTIYLCKDDPSFILSANNKLDDDSLMMEYLKRAGSYLFVLKSTIPSVQRAMLYVNNVQKFITDSRSIYTKDVFIETFSKDLARKEVAPDFSNMEDGWMVYQNFALYIMNVYNYGKIIFQVNVNELADIQSINTVNEGQNVIVLYKDKYYFASSMAEKAGLLEKLDFSSYKNNTEVSLPGGGDILCHMERVEMRNFTFLFFYELSTIEKSYSLINHLSVILICVELIILLGMVWINTTPSRMLRRVLKKYGYHEQKREIQFVDEMFQQYESRQQAITAENQLWRSMQLNVVINYLVGTEKELPPKTLDFLLEYYHNYFIIYLVGQDENGRLDNVVFTDLDEYLSDFYYCNGVSLNSFEKIYIVEKSDLKLNIISILQQYFSGFEGKLRVYAGLSGEYTDISKMRYAISEARSNLGLAKVKDAVLSIAEKPENQEPYTGINISNQRTIIEMAFQNDINELKDILGHILLEKSSMCYKDLKGICNVLIEQLHSVVNSIHMNDEGILLTTLKTDQFHHPVYFYNTILSDYRAVGEYLDRIKNKAYDYKSEILAYLDSHYYEELTLQSVADHFHITSVYFSRLFKAQNGINFSVYLSNLRMEKAKALMLKNPDIKNQEIAESVGITNTLTLIRQFRMHSGLTPDQFKKIAISR